MKQWATIGLMALSFGAGWWYAQPPDHNEFRNYDVGLYGGVVISSRVGDIWGFDDDMGACQQLAAGMNYYWTLPESRQASFLQTPGKAFCRAGR